MNTQKFDEITAENAGLHTLEKLEHKAVEEMAELTVELMHKEESRGNFIEELVDVMIIANSLYWKYVCEDFGSEFDAMMDYKLERLKRRNNGE